MKMKKTRIKIDKVKGRGVYAHEPIRKGDLIEVCHLIVLPAAEVGETLERFVFSFSDTHYAMALGNGPLYNHSDRPNAIVEMDDDALLIEVSALGPIKKGDEITIDYGYTKEERKKYGIR